MLRIINSWSTGLRRHPGNRTVANPVQKRCRNPLQCSPSRPICALIKFQRHHKFSYKSHFTCITHKYIYIYIKEKGSYEKKGRARMQIRDTVLSEATTETEPKERFLLFKYNKITTDRWVDCDKRLFSAGANGEGLGKKNKLMPSERWCLKMLRKNMQYLNNIRLEKQNTI